MAASSDTDALIVGGGIGGLTLALELERIGIRSIVAEAVKDNAPVGLGVTLLPHATECLVRLGLEGELMGGAIVARNIAFYNRFGQLVYTEPVGAAAGVTSPQLQIHRAHLHQILRDAVKSRLGGAALLEGHRVEAVRDDGRSVTAVVSLSDGQSTEITGSFLVGADGIHSTVRRQLVPGEGKPRYSGVTVWRGATWWPSFLDGATMVRVGCVNTGQLVVYPVMTDPSDRSRQLVNWVIELVTPQRSAEAWNVSGRLEDCIGPVRDWSFDWLDVPGLLRSTETILTFPMVDREPLTKWTAGRVTLLGDAAHPMIPRGSNGAGQTILDAHCLAEMLLKHGTDVPGALCAYETRRLPATGALVEANHRSSPDAILTLVHERSPDAPFEDVRDVLRPGEAEEILRRYEKIARA